MNNVGTVSGRICRKCYSNNYTKSTVGKEGNGLPDWGKGEGNRMHLSFANLRALVLFCYLHAMATNKNNNNNNNNNNVPVTNTAMTMTFVVVKHALVDTAI